MKCKKCKLVLTVEEMLKCGNCHSQYHFACLLLSRKNFANLPTIQKNNWRCDPCRLVEPRSTRSQFPTSTPERSRSLTPTNHNLTTSRADEITRKPLNEPQQQVKVTSEMSTGNQMQRQVLGDTEIQIAIAPLLEEIRSLRREFIQMREEVRECSCRGQCEETKQEMLQLKEKVQRLEGLENEVKSLSATIQEMKKENNARDQWSRMNNVEIVGIPERKDENLTVVTCKIAAFFGIPLQPSDVQFAHRVTPRSENARKPKIVIAKLARVDLKDNLIAAVRLKRGLSTKDIGFPGEEKKIFINYHLSRDNKNLLLKTKEYAKSKGIKYVWVSRSRIFLRRSDTSPVQLISTIADFDKII